MDIFGQAVGLQTELFLILAIGMALGFEFVNGFHDTANAVATVIYTNSLRPTVAVVWSGIWNLAGVLVSSGAVAFGVIALLPVELVLNVGTAAGFAMVMALLTSAILWNLGTWYFGLPASSSHTLIGSIMGVGLANSVLQKGQVFGEGVNWAKAGEVGSSLVLSPIVGFTAAALLLLLAKALIRRPELYRPPEANKPPPPWIRALLVLTCTGVSFAHGSNDGQKGMGLIMLILVGILPAGYAVDLATDADLLRELTQTSARVGSLYPGDVGATSNQSGESATTDELSAFLKTAGVLRERTLPALSAKAAEIHSRLNGHESLREVSGADRRSLRSDIYLVTESIRKLDKLGKLNPADKSTLLDYAHNLELTTKFIPDWVKMSVALALGLGTMIGWKRIVVTVGEKIGKEHLSYAQGASAELVAMTTIAAADVFGLPVSTTHVLSSGVAGTMAANRSGLQMGTLRNLLLAWVLTLPVCVILGATIFALGLNLILAVGFR